MIVQVLKGYQGQGTSQLVMQTVGDLTAALRTEVETGVDEAIRAYTETLKSDTLFEKARTLLGKIRQGAARVKFVPPTGSPTTYPANDPQVRLAALSLAGIMTSANPVAAAEAVAAGGTAPAAGKLLKHDDFSYLLAELYNIAVQAKDGAAPLTAPLMAPLITTFDPANVGTDKTAFHGKLVTELLP